MNLVVIRMPTLSRAIDRWQYFFGKGYEAVQNLFLTHSRPSTFNINLLDIECFLEL